MLLLQLLLLRQVVFVSVMSPVLSMSVMTQGHFYGGKVVSIAFVAKVAPVNHGLCRCLRER